MKLTRGTPPKIKVLDTYNRGGRIILNVEVQEGSLNIGDYVDLDGKNVRINNILFHGLQVPVIVKGESGLVVLDDFAPFIKVNNAKITPKEIVTENSYNRLVSEGFNKEKAKKLVHKIVTEKPLEREEQIRKLGIGKTISTVRPAEYRKLLLSHCEYLYMKLYANDCLELETPTERTTCKKKVIKRIIKYLNSEKKYASRAQDPQTYITVIDSLIQRYSKKM